MMSIILVGIGGFCGSIARYLIGLSLAGFTGGLPVHTLLINFSGSLLIGSLMVWGPEKLGFNTFYFLVPGLLGGFTTYSAFSGETFLLLKNNQHREALIYIVLTVTGSLLATASGFWIGRSIFKT